MPERPERILLIEDNEDNRIVYTTILQHFGFEVIEANSGEEGLALARSLKPALILMDVGLPGIDGWEATMQLRADPATHHIPIIALTAHALAEHRARAFEVGCDDYLAKPVEPREVLAVVQRHLDRAAAGRRGARRTPPPTAKMGAHGG